MWVIVLIILALVIIAVIYGKQQTPKIKTQKPADLMTAANKIAATSTNKDYYWKSFKIRKPSQAKEIEELLERDMSKVSDIDAFQLVSMLLRVSQNAQTPISQLKQSAQEQLLSQVTDPNELDPIIANLKEEKIKESKAFNISPNNTYCNLLLEWTIEHQEKLLQSQLTDVIGKKLGLNSEEKNQFENSIQGNMDNLKIAPDISKLDREENHLIELAEEGAKMLDNLVVKVGEEPLQLSNAGFAEARLLCSVIVMKDLHSNFENEIDMDNEIDRYFLLLHDKTIYDCDKIEDSIKFINERIKFYKREVEKTLNPNLLQVFVPNNVYAKLFNVLYLNPECKDPYSIEEGSVSTNDCVMFKGQFDKVYKYLTKKSSQIRGESPSSERDLLQEEIEAALMKLFPPAKRNEVNQDVVYVITDVVLRDLKESNFNSQIFTVLPLNLQQEFRSLAQSVKAYSIENDDIKDIFELAQTNIANKFPN